MGTVTAFCIIWGHHQLLLTLFVYLCYAVYWMHVVKFTCGHFPQQGHFRCACKVTYISTAASFTLIFLAAPMKARYFLKSKITKYTAVQILQRPLK